MSLYLKHVVLLAPRCLALSDDCSEDVSELLAGAVPPGVGGNGQVREHHTDGTAEKEKETKSRGQKGEPL